MSQKNGKKFILMEDNIELYMKTKIFILFYIVLACVAFSQEINYVETINVINKLEKSGKWEDALPLYNKLYDHLKVNLDGLTINFIYKKGICERQCSKYEDAENSFRIIKNLDRKILRKDEINTIPMAMFQLADVQARAGKIKEAEKSLKEANDYLQEFSKVGSHQELLEWCDKANSNIQQIITNAQ